MYLQRNNFIYELINYILTLTSIIAKFNIPKVTGNIQEESGIVRFGIKEKPPTISSVKVNCALKSVMGSI